MKIIAIEIENVRGFQKIPKLDLSETINIFIGPNNAGKSTILNSIYQIQRRVLNKEDITLGNTIGKIILYSKNYNLQHGPNITPIKKLIFRLENNQRHWCNLNSSKEFNLELFHEFEPYNVIYPYLSKRKVGNYVDTINEQNANSVTGNFTNLFSKIDRLSTPQFLPGNDLYINACNSILGFEISTLAKANGKQAVYFIHNTEHIPLTAMGEGVASVLGLITDLCVAENKIFLIEEPENDIHPKALKALLNLIIERSSSNQFFISTHSNIVMKYLGGIADSKIFNVNNNNRDTVKPKLFISTVNEIPKNPEIRRQVLEDLGYDFFDFDLWKGWLFLEESSAEVIIREYLIDWFVKPLKNKLKTFSAGGSSSVLPKFEDFDRLFIFLHMEPVYKNKVWVIIDAGEEEEKIINKMKDKYSKSGWIKSNFSQFKHHDFENYYPKEFQEKFYDSSLVYQLWRSYSNYESFEN